MGVPKLTTVDKAQIIGSLSTAAALFLLFAQTCVSNRQLQVQIETSNRAWTAELLAIIYSDPPLPKSIREHAVRTYLNFQRDTHEKMVLSEANFKNLDLSGVDFTGAYLAKSNFKAATLIGTIFNNATMTSTDMSSAIMPSAKFIGADLSRALFANATVSSGDFSNATLSGTYFSVPVKDMASNLVQGYKWPAEARGAVFADAIFDEDTEVCKMNVFGGKLAEAIGMTSKHLKVGCLLIDGQTTLPPH